MSPSEITRSVSAITGAVAPAAMTYAAVLVGSEYPLKPQVVANECFQHQDRAEVDDCNGDDAITRAGGRS